jgi:hypothetical protein
MNRTDAYFWRPDRRRHRTDRGKFAQPPRGKTGTEMAITAGDGMKLGMLVFGLLRAIASLGDD